jgi:dephospho-CoA kinase
MLVLGLTGTLAAGKSTVAAMFAEMGVAVFDADAAVHALYRGEAVAPVGDAFPGVVTNGVVDRTKLGEKVASDRAALARLEAIVHPLVRAKENAFRADAATSGRRIALLDIPLLLEGGGENRVDAVVVATAPLEVRRQRIAARPGISAAKADALVARQMDDAEKRRRAHFVIDTNCDLAETRRAAAALLRAVAAIAAGR